MSGDEILRLKKIVNEDLPEYDPAFVAQIAKFILSVGRKQYKKDESLEYKGPMFWTLAHASMSRWMKLVIGMMADTAASRKPGMPDDGTYRWGAIEDKYLKKLVTSGKSKAELPDYLTARAFFEKFRDGRGRKAFSTEVINDTKNILGDFIIKPLLTDMVVTTDAALSRKEGKNMDTTGPVEVIDSKKLKYTGQTASQQREIAKEKKNDAKKETYEDL